MGKTIKRVFKYVITLILAVVILLLGLIFIFEKGPSESIRDIFVMTVTQSSAAKFTAHIFLSKETVDSILAEGNVDDEGVVIDTELVNTDNKDNDFDINAIWVEDIQSAHYKGKAMIINDPSRVYVYCIPEFPVEKGKFLKDICKEENAIGGVNGGGFIDVAGLGQGGEPKGMVVCNGVWLNGEKSEKHRVIGLSNDNKLIVGTMTGDDAMKLGLRDAVEWGPALIINGQPVSVSESADGPNPRTAIGQRGDGSIVLVCIEGRRLDSIGANYADLIDIMQRYGCVNASNLDGGLSSSMNFDGEKITNSYSAYGERPIPTAILVRR
ncbi:MAG: phosphodiester glycosidase family protein [Bacillota bacterium]|nr:phosphodiester glycosidase family protein [Bacillota bacterium]